MSKFKVGDKVVVAKELNRERYINSVLGWDENMDEVTGKQGVVHEHYFYDGSPLVQFEYGMYYLFEDDMKLVKQVKEKKVMKKEKVIERFYVVQRGDEVVDHADTRAQARRTQQACGGASNGVKIFQRVTIQKEVR